MEAAQAMDWENPRFLLTLIAMCDQPPPVGLSEFQKQRFLSEMLSYSERCSLDTVTAAMLAELVFRQQLDGAIERLKRKELPGTPQSRLELLVRILNQTAGEVSPGRATSRVRWQYFSTVDEGVKALLLLYEEGLGNYFGRSNAATALRLLHPLLVAGAPSLLPVQEQWIRENFGRETLDPQKILAGMDLPSSRGKHSPTLRRRLARYLQGLESP